MKKIIHILIFTFIVNLCFSQIPNSGFENWTSMGSYENPDSWGTMNNTTALSGIFTATKATPGSPGSYYLKLTSQTIASVVVNGIAVSGILDSVNQIPKSGFPFSLRPQSFTGKWQHMISGTSQGSVSVLLTQWNAPLSKRDTIATASQTLSGMAMSWANFSINFVYESGAFPDTCIIVLKASGATPAAGDYLWADNLAFSGSVVGISENNIQKLSMISFPNPANNEIKFSFPTTLNKGDLLIITDMLGNEVLRKTINDNTFKLNTQNFANGNYICKLVNKFNIQYSSDKFTIQH